MLSKSCLVDILSQENIRQESINRIVDAIFASTPMIGVEVFVVTRYTRVSPFEVVRCTVTRKTLGKKGTTFTVEGHYSSRPHYYNATFTQSAVRKTVFFSKEDAQNMCTLHNKKSQLKE